MVEKNLAEEMTRIYNETYDDVLKYVVCKCKNPSDISDIMQNVYMKFYNRLSRSDIAQPSHYLIKIAKHEIFSHYKIWDLDQKNIPVFSENEEDNFNDIEYELSLEFSDSTPEIYGELWQFIENCDELTFKIFILHFQYDMKIDDVAEQLGVSPSTVKNRLYRTIKQLRAKYIKTEEHHEPETIIKENG